MFPQLTQLQILFSAHYLHILLCIISIMCIMWRSCYQSFQREVSSHQPLTSSVLHTGQLLLSCINATSPCQCVTCIMSQQPQPFSSFSQVFMPSPLFPVLRETLLLIEKQSGALGMHTEHFFSSILSAMDSLTQPRPVQQSREEDPGLVGVKGSALWLDCRMWTSMIYFSLFFTIFQQFYSFNTRLMSVN